jgi:hypothetical protein
MDAGFATPQAANDFSFNAARADCRRKHVRIDCTILTKGDEG